MSKTKTQGGEMSDNTKWWQCIYCGTKIHTPEIVLAKAVCECGRGKGRWGVRRVGEGVTPPQTNPVKLTMGMNTLYVDPANPDHISDKPFSQVTPPPRVTLGPNLLSPESLCVVCRAVNTPFMLDGKPTCTTCLNIKRDVTPPSPEPPTDDELARDLAGYVLGKVSDHLGLRGCEIDMDEEVYQMNELIAEMRKEFLEDEPAVSQGQAQTPKPDDIPEGTEHPFQVFTDISSEEFRQYDFPGGETVRIEAPLQLSVSDSGHRVFDAAGVSHYVPLGWLHLQWKAKEGQPNFVR